jgi:hypothetical protein
MVNQFMGHLGSHMLGRVLPLTVKFREMESLMRMLLPRLWQPLHARLEGHVRENPLIYP